ncbi:MAG: Cna B-type domain-containing protein [Ruminococcaceae bacterium]|nr:Cna B-type domain-containing protein [Oscillospiraceae bacterium]
MRIKIIYICIAAIFILSMPITAFAQEFDANRIGSISVTLTEQAGAELSVYYVATVKINERGNLSYTYTDEFEDCGTSLDDSRLAAKLDLFVEGNAVPVATLFTDSYGKVVFDNLPLGLYFVKQISSADGNTICTPFMVTVPSKIDGKYVYDVNASPKTEVVKLISVTIKKVWNTDSAVPAADSVTVQLLRDGIVVRTAELNKQNNWTVVYKDMPMSDLYSINEINIPEGFTATYSQKDYEFTVTNSSSLIQTGQLIWPIPILVIAGLMLIAVGTVMLRKSGKANA